ncbi:glycosyltransferase family 9 protein [Candidatus Avelusimicrobium sp.]|uniref:glycosyltransferase family 9 protein n=1 Tax=Candidatus Avelusimicrobium sp. TaxID=3048833 RepID=UPI003D7C97C7
MELLEESKAFEHKCNTKEVELQQQKLNIKLGVDYLQARLNRYTHKYTSVNKIATHMLWACFLAAVSKRQQSQHNSGTVRICLTIEGGMGDMLMSLNLATAFYKKFCKDQNIEFFVCSYNVSLLPHLTSTQFHFLSQNERDAQVFDLKITCNRTPIVQYANLQRLSSDLLGYVEKLLDLEREYKYFLTVPYKDCITQNIVSNLQKRWAQPDLVNEFNLQEDWLLDVPIDREKETLQKFGLTTKPYITINREVGDTQLVDSTKLWPVEYYRKLVDELKKVAPQYQIVEVGRGKGERLGNTHKNLAGKTSIEEIKVILKNAVLHIDSEGGLVHLRHALKGGPSCVFFGPSSPEVLGYSENINLCSHACPIHCEFYSRTWQETCIKQKHICMNTILPEYALKQIKIKLGL